MHDPQSSLTDLPHRMRQQAADFKSNYRQWRQDVRADPALLLRSMPVRLALWVLLGIVAYFVIRGIWIGFAPVAPVEERDAKPTATLYVACTSPDCQKSYTTTIERESVAWPLTCTVCKEPGVYRAEHCRKCRKWYSNKPGSGSGCPHCAKTARAKSETKAQATTRSSDPDDDEDGWD